MTREDDAPTTMVTISERQDRDTIEAEIPVYSLRELYDTCRRLAKGALVRVHLKDTAGEVRLNFASFIRPGEAAGTNE